MFFFQLIYTAKICEVYDKSTNDNCARIISNEYVNCNEVLKCWKQITINTSLWDCCDGNYVIDYEPGIGNSFTISKHNEGIVFECHNNMSAIVFENHLHTYNRLCGRNKLIREIYNAEGKREEIVCQHFDRIDDKNDIFYFFKRIVSYKLKMKLCREYQKNNAINYNKNNKEVLYERYLSLKDNEEYLDVTTQSIQNITNIPEDELLSEDKEMKEDKLNDNIEINKGILKDSLELKNDKLNDNMEIKKGILKDSLELKKDLSKDDEEIFNDNMEIKDKFLKVKKEDKEEILTVENSSKDNKINIDETIKDKNLIYDKKKEIKRDNSDEQKFLSLQDEDQERLKRDIKSDNNIFQDAISEDVYVRNLYLEDDDDFLYYQSEIRENNQKFYKPVEDDDDFLYYHPEIRENNQKYYKLLEDDFYFIKNDVIINNNDFKEVSAYDILTNTFDVMKIGLCAGFLFSVGLFGIYKLFKKKPKKKYNELIDI